MRLATRGSLLALTQAGGVADRLGGAELVIAPSGEGVEDKARFVRGVEQKVLAGDAEIGVHSAKDLPSTMPAELMIAGVPAREQPEDAWIGVGRSLEEVPQGARVGTSSLRRRAQLLAARPDLEVTELRGNVDTRMGRLESGDYDAIILAAAGLRRLGRETEISFLIPPETMTPAAGQGTLVIQARRDDAEILALCASVTDESALTELFAERAAISTLEADCDTPVGIFARRDGDELNVDGFVGLPDGSRWVRDQVTGGAGQCAELGRELAERMLLAGAGEMLADLRRPG